MPFIIITYLNPTTGTSLVVQWLRLCLLMQEGQSLVGDLKIPHASQPKKQNIKQEQYCNKFNKDLKNGPRKKKKILKNKKPPQEHCEEGGIIMPPIHYMLRHREVKQLA